MAADPKQVLRILAYRRIRVRLEDGRLIARHESGEIPDDMIQFIRYFKDLIVAELRSRERTAA